MKKLEDGIYLYEEGEPLPKEAEEKSLHVRVEPEKYNVYTTYGFKNDRDGIRDYRYVTDRETIDRVEKLISNSKEIKKLREEESMEKQCQQKVERAVSITALVSFILASLIIYGVYHVMGKPAEEVHYPMMSTDALEYPVFRVPLEKDVVPGVYVASDDLFFYTMDINIDYNTKEVMVYFTQYENNEEQYNWVFPCTLVDNGNILSNEGYFIMSMNYKNADWIKGGILYRHSVKFNIIKDPGFEFLTNSDMPFYCIYDKSNVDL